MPTLYFLGGAKKCLYTFGILKNKIYIFVSYKYTFNQQEQSRKIVSWAWTQSLMHLSVTDAII